MRLDLTEARVQVSCTAEREEGRGSGLGGELGRDGLMDWGVVERPPFLK